MPVSEQISTTADNLAAAASANVTVVDDALDSLLLAAISDYGRLKAIESLATNSTATATDLETHLTAAANRYFVSELSPLEYSPYSLRYVPAPSAPAPGDSCNLVGGLYNFGGNSPAPTGAWTRFLRRPVIPFQQGGTGWETRIVSYVGAFYYYYLPDSIVTPLFNYPSVGSKYGNGWGAEKTTWFWEQGDAQGDNAGTCSGP
jgi:hypothetical protein